MELKELSSNLIKDSENYAEVISACSSLLKHSKKAKNAKNELKKRISSLKIENFTFGYFPKNNELHLLFEYIEPETLENLNLIYKKCVYDSGHAEIVYFSILNNHNLIMPYKNLYGDIIGMVGRSLLSKEERSKNKISKYKNTFLTKSLNLFGMYEAKKEIIKQDSVIITEGQFDCISCHRFGLKNTIALGGSAFTKYHFYLLKRYTNNIYLALDNDDSGYKETKNILNKFSNKANIYQIKFNSCYKDIDECLRKDNASIEKIKKTLQKK